MRRIDEGNIDFWGNVIEEVGVENGGNGCGFERENEVDLEVVVMRIIGVVGLKSNIFISYFFFL